MSFAAITGDHYGDVEAARGLAAGGDGRAVRGDDRPGDGQAEPDAVADAGPRFHPPERLRCCSDARRAVSVITRTGRSTRPDMNQPMPPDATVEHHDVV
jgi:hypothetical protein